MADWTSVASYVLLFLLIFGITGTVDLSSFRSRLGDYRSLLLGISCQFVALPLIGFTVVRLMQLPPLYGLVLLVTVSSPGGSYSNWWCALCNADLALSVAMTTISTIASVGLLPLNMVVYVNASYDQDVTIDWLNLGISILVVITSIFCGLYAGLKLPHWRGQLNTLGNVCGVALIALGIAFNSSSPVPLWSHTRDFYIAVSLPCIIGMAMSLALSLCLRVPRPTAVAITVEVCYQNTGIALTVALSTFHGDQAAIATGVPLFYSAVQVVLIAGLALTAWRLGWTYSPPSDNMLKCITQNYQPVDPSGSRVHPGAPAEAPDAVDEPGNVGGRGQEGSIERAGQTAWAATSQGVPTPRCMDRAPAAATLTGGPWVGVGPAADARAVAAAFAPDILSPGPGRPGVWVRESSSTVFGHEDAAAFQGDGMEVVVRTEWIEWGQAPTDSPAAESAVPSFAQRSMERFRLPALPSRPIPALLPDQALGPDAPSVLAASVSPERARGYFASACSVSVLAPDSLGSSGGLSSSGRTIRRLARKAGSAIKEVTSREPQEQGRHNQTWPRTGSQEHNLTWSREGAPQSARDLAAAPEVSVALQPAANTAAAPAIADD